MPRSIFYALLSITLLQTALVLNYSAREGRLALPVYFDDNHSLVDGARRLEIWYQHGATALFRDYLANPPHAPGHSALAMAAFALFGFHAWAPYLTNGVFFAAILYALLLVLRDNEAWLQIACLILLASTPIAGISILEFRSEVNVAELGALGVALFITWNSGRSSLGRLVASALCFAACFIIKPPVFPYTLGLMGLCALFHLRRLLPSASQRITLQHYLLSMGVFILAAVLPPLPHYLLDWHQITGYIGNIAFSPSSVWLRHDSLSTSLLFNLTGYPGKIMLGGFLKPCLAVIVAGLIVRVYRRESWPKSLPLLPMIFFTLGAYLGVAINLMNQNYFGMTFHWLFLITTLLALCGTLTVLFPRHVAPCGVLLACIAIILFFGFKFPLSIDFYKEKAGGDQAIFAWLQQIPELVMNPIRQENRDTGATKVWITAYTMINARTLEWYSLLHHEPFLYQDFIESDWRVVPQRLDWADVVVVPEKGTPSIESIIPNAVMADKMVEQLEHDNRFRLILRLPSPHNGPGFRIYAKKPSFSPFPLSTRAFPQIQSLKIRFLFSPADLITPHSLT